VSTAQAAQVHSSDPSRQNGSDPVQARQNGPQWGSTSHGSQTGSGPVLLQKLDDLQSVSSSQRTQAVPSGEQTWPEKVQSRQPSPQWSASLQVSHFPALHHSPRPQWMSSMHSEQS